MKNRHYTNYPGQLGSQWPSPAISVGVNAGTTVGNERSCDAPKREHGGVEWRRNPGSANYARGTVAWAALSTSGMTQSTSMSRVRWFTMHARRQNLPRSIALESAGRCGRDRLRVEMLQIFRRQFGDVDSEPPEFVGRDFEWIHKGQTGFRVRLTNGCDCPLNPGSRQCETVFVIRKNSAVR